MDFKVNINKKQSPWNWVVYSLIFLTGLTISILFIYSWKTIDEGDNLSVGWLLSEGKVLYKDIFCHHFPFPYFFLSLIFRIFPVTVFSARFSFLIFELIAFLYLFFATKRYSEIGLTFLIWSIISRFFLGNLILYYSFTGLSIFVVFVLVIYVCFENSQDGKEKFTTPVILGISFYSAVSVLSDPTSAIPIFIILLSLLIITKKAKKVLFIILGSSLFISPFIFYLILDHALVDFYQNAIVFNKYYYLNYNSGSSNLFTNLWTFLKNFNPFTDSFALNPGGLPRNIRDSSQVIQWFFGGFYYRAVLIGFTLFLGLRNWKSAILILIFFISLFFRSEVFFHPIGMLMIAVFCSLYLLIRFIEYIFQTRKTPFVLQSFGKLALQILCSLVIVFFFSSMIVYSISDYAKNPDQIYYSTSFGQYKDTIQRISTLSCNKPDVNIAFYPSDPYVFFFTKIEPFEGYLFMYPWIVDIAKEDILSALRVENHSNTLLWIDKEGSFWGYKNTDYLSDYINYLDEKYIQTSDGYYISPALFATCQNH